MYKIGSTLSYKSIYCTKDLHVCVHARHEPICRTNLCVYVCAREERGWEEETDTQNVHLHVVPINLIKRWRVRSVTKKMQIIMVLSASCIPG